jgi:hypothetical protein
MEKEGVVFTSRMRAVLRGYRLLFNKKSLHDRLPDVIGFANINECVESTVEGILYDIVAEHLPVLDDSERYPEHYDRQKLWWNPIPRIAGSTKRNPTRLLMDLCRHRSSGAMCAVVGSLSRRPKP